MIDGLKPYPAYKPSGVPWLGDVPEHWEVRRLKTIAILNPSRSQVKGSLSPETLVTFLPMERVGTDGRVDFKEIRPLASVCSGFTNFMQGDVLIAKITPCFENGKGACLDRMPTLLGFGSTEFHVLRPLPIVCSQFLYRITTLPDFRRLGTDAMIGAAGQQRVPGSFVAGFVAPLPPVLEQQAIVRFLDYVDRRIRRYIRAKQKLIKLLNEQKQVIIHRAVTRGLDPNVRLKPSGVPWLGDIPAHWEMRRLKHLVRNVNEQTDTKSPDEVYIALEHVESWTGRLVLAEREVIFESQVKRFRPNDILFGKLRPYLAKVTRPQRNGVCVGEFLVLRVVDPVILPEFLEQKLRSKQLIDLINSSTFGAKMPRAEWAFIGNVVIAYPPTHQEQQMILDQIKQETALLSSTITATQCEIELLREYRTRLVADVVTGKLDVRGVEVPTPEEEGEEEEPAVEVEEEMEEMEEAEEVEADAGD